MPKRWSHLKREFDANLPWCNHRGKIYQCNEVNPEEIEVCKKQLYGKSATKIEQDQHLFQYISVASPMRRRPSFKNLADHKRKPHNVAISYTIPCRSGSKIVCKSFLMQALKVSKFRLIRLAKILQDGKIPKEKRGGDRVSHQYLPTRKSIREFLAQLQGSESHYGRNKSKRIYLNCNLSIAKLYRIYIGRPNVDIKKPSFSMFHRIFCRDFNIGFGSPACDTCSLCERLDHAIKQETDRAKRNTLVAERRIHKIRVREFYDLIKESPERTRSFCFHLQQVQPLPRTPVSEAFYLRQIGYYSLGIVQPDYQDPYFYTWTETEAGRTSTEVASALLNYLNNLNPPKDIINIRLFCDGCVGQSKNSLVVHTLMYWLHRTSTSVENIVIIYPVMGHNSLPVDRDFGRVEKILLKEPYIKTREKYNSLYKEVGTVKLIGQDWNLVHVKELEKIYKKIPGISEMKRIFLAKHTKNNKVTVRFRGLCTYKFNSATDIYQTLCKRGQTAANLELKKLAIERTIPTEKINNLKTILTAAFTTDWHKDGELTWCKKLIDLSENNKQLPEEEESEEDHVQCNCNEEDADSIDI